MANLFCLISELKGFRMKAANRDFTRAVNQFNILNSIREAGSISRVEIAELTGQSRASVTNITALMIGQGLLRE